MFYTAAQLKINVFWYIRLCRLASGPDISKAIPSLEKFRITHQKTRPRIPKDLNLHISSN